MGYTVPQLRNLVDEFFFEHHVHYDGPDSPWSLRSSDAQRPRDAYRLLSELRAAGVRAHAWP